MMNTKYSIRYDIHIYIYTLFTLLEWIEVDWFDAMMQYVSIPIY